MSEPEHVASASCPLDEEMRGAADGQCIFVIGDDMGQSRAATVFVDHRRQQMHWGWGIWLILRRLRRYRESVSGKHVTELSRRQDFEAEVKRQKLPKRIADILRRGRLRATVLLNTPGGLQSDVEEYGQLMDMFAAQGTPPAVFATTTAMSAAANLFV